MLDVTQSTMALTIMALKAECCCAEWLMLRVIYAQCLKQDIMLCVIMLTVVNASVIMLNVVNARGSLC